MSKILTTAATIIVLGLAATGAADAAPLSLHSYYAHRGHAGPMFGYQPQQTFTPQFNNPGPQISVPQTGNALDQLSPIMGAGQPDALGIR